MLKKRIIPCLDVKNGRTVKGVNFQALRDAGDALELAAFYAQEGADELVLLDISASEEGRSTMVEFARSVARQVNIPFTIGGGIRSVANAEKLLEAGADKISINSAALERPTLISELAYAFGNQFVVLAMDIKEQENNADYALYTKGGKSRSSIKTELWLQEAQDRGAGELLISSIKADGTKQGFDKDLYRYVAANSALPLIASGGAGKKEHFKEVFELECVDAALAASLFHYKELEIRDLKEYLRKEGISVRL